MTLRRADGMRGGASVATVLHALKGAKRRLSALHSDTPTKIFCDNRRQLKRDLDTIALAVRALATGATFPEH